MTGPARRGRLFRKYVVVLFVLVGGVLMAASLVELYFSYRETQRAIVREERAKDQDAGLDLAALEHADLVQRIRRHHDVVSFGGRGEA
jgi:hypothetical protein